MLTTKEIADLLRVSEQTIYRWRKQGLPFMSFGGVIRYDSREVIEWLKEHNKQ